MGDYTHQQLSDFLEMPLATVNNRLRMARRRLKKEIVDGRGRAGPAQMPG
jgi:DNA-directed RNA polymerase specialized sigma24 family protein